MTLWSYRTCLLGDDIVQKISEQKLELQVRTISSANNEENYCETDLVQIVRPIRLRLVDTGHNSLDLVPASPLNVARVLVDPSDVLPHLGLDRLQEEGVDGVQRVREDELGPGEDAQLVTGAVEVIPAGELVRRLVDTATPDAKLQECQRICLQRTRRLDAPCFAR